MRKVAFFLFVIAILVGGVCPFVDFQESQRVTLVCNDLPSQYLNEAIKSGNDFYITTTTERAKSLAKELDVRGYVLYFNKDKKIDFVDYTLSDSNIDGYRVVTGYTNRFQKYRIVDGKKVNIQIAYTGEKIVVGLPLILTGF